MACLTPYRGDTSQLLLYKIASCLAGGDESGPVQSFNGRGGAVSLLSADVTAALGYTPLSQAAASALYVLKAGDTMTGALAIGTGSVAVSTPVLSLSQTWNAGGGVFTGVLFNFTNTASAAGSMLFDVQMDALTKFHITNDGNFRFNRQDQTNTGVQFFLRKRGDSVSSTAAIASGAGIGTIFFSGWNGAGSVQSASIRGIAEELFTGSVNGTRVDVFATAAGGNTSVVIAQFKGTGLLLSRSFSAPIVAKTGTYTITDADYTVNCTANSFTVTLPTAVAISGRIHVIKNSGAGAITLATTSAQTIDGAATQNIAAGAAMRVQSNGANWFII